MTTHDHARVAAIRNEAGRHAGDVERDPEGLAGHQADA